MWVLESRQSISSSKWTNSSIYASYFLYDFDKTANNGNNSKKNCFIYCILSVLLSDLHEITPLSSSYTPSKLCGITLPILEGRKQRHKKWNDLPKDWELKSTKKKSDSEPQLKVTTFYHHFLSTVSNTLQSTGS